VAQGLPLFDPVTDQAQVDRYGPRGSVGAPGESADYRLRERNAARNEGGQVTLRRNEGKWGESATEAERNERDARLSGASEELRAQGSRIFDTLESLVLEWRKRLSSAAPVDFPPRLGPQQLGEAGSAEQAWNSYAESLHRKVHSVYSDGFLNRLDHVSATHALQQASLRATVSLVIDAKTGEVLQLALIGSSDSELFDVAALESISRASPFGLPPRQVVSSDAKVYLSWELHRNIDYACSTAFLRLHLEPSSTNGPSR
jgi:hypothetical protein